MSKKQSVLEQLERLLKQKQSKQWYADKLGITIEEVTELLKELRNSGSYESDKKFEEDIAKGTAIITGVFAEEIKTLEELIDKCDIDTDKWEIDRYVQNYWGNKNNPHWQVKAWLSIKKEQTSFQEAFKDFLLCNPVIKPAIIREENEFLKPNACLVINKQDEHINKFDTDGDNDINDRMNRVFNAINTVLDKASLSNNIEQIIYILGSDGFNSEWTGFTTKGTTQQNIGTYEDTFKHICRYEVAIIDKLLKNSLNVTLKYVQGNHDEYVGWHLVTWLQAYYLNESRLFIDSSTECTKCIRYSNTAMMFNHGDAIKPAKLAVMFPQMFKNEWSNCDNFYIFTGDKHHEKSEDLGGIIFYQLPALSKANSKWDKKNGHILSKAELTAFLIEEGIGRTDIMKRPI